MSDAAKEIYTKEESFGQIDSGFYDFTIEAEFEDVRIIAWPEKYAIADPIVEFDKALRDVLKGSRRIERDLSRCMAITFTDVYAVNIRQEGWEEWQWDHTKVPKTGTGKLSIRNFPILKIENSVWKDQIFPEWNRDWMDRTSHWRLISFTNCIDILARSGEGEWRKGD